MFTLLPVLVGFGPAVAEKSPRRLGHIFVFVLVLSCQEATWRVHVKH